MALIIALSVFNGLEGIIRGLHETFHPDLKIEVVRGKAFPVDSSLLQSIEEVPGVQTITEVIEDNALLRYKDGQKIAVLKGVSRGYSSLYGLDSTLVHGDFILEDEAHDYAVIGRGVHFDLQISIYNPLEPLQVWYPKKNQKINLSKLTPEANFKRLPISVQGVFSLEQSYDESYVFVPLRFMQGLLDYDSQRTSLEIKLQSPKDLAKVQSKLRKLMGEGFRVLNRDEQEASLLRAIQLEKLFVFLTLSFILAVASFNIFFMLMMLAIDKQKDLAILFSLGAEPKLVRRIFIYEGALVALGGAAAGLFLGTVLCLIQQYIGIVPLGTTTSIVQYYPVELRLGDFLYTGLAIMTITFLSSFFPASQAAKVIIKEHL